MPLLDPTFVSTANPTAGSAASATHAATTGKAHICQTIHCTLAGNSSNTSAAAAAATGAASAIAPTFGGAAGTTALIMGFQITGLGATGASVITVTLTGVLGGTISYSVPIPAGTTTSITPLYVQFPGNGLQASAAAQAITLNVPSFGAGNTFSSAAMQGTILNPPAGSLVLRDGTSGVGAVLWSSGMSVVPLSGASSAPVEVSGLAIAGTIGNAMTLEFTGGLTNCLETVAFTGFLT